MIAGHLKWLRKLSTPPNASLRLVCFPYAGAGASVFRNWTALLPADTELWAIQLPGRESRFIEPPVDRMEPIVKSVASEFLQLPEKPFAFFGHSMGALIAFETVRLLREQRTCLPVCLFVSGNRPPQSQEMAPRTYDLPEKEFLEAIQRMNGTPPEILNDPELMELLLPVMRADLAVCQTYRYVAAQPLACLIVAFGGQDDPDAPPELLAAWAEQTEREFRPVILPGGHFYLQTSEARFLEYLSIELRSASAKSAGHSTTEATQPGHAPVRGS